MHKLTIISFKCIIDAFYTCKITTKCTNGVNMKILFSLKITQRSFPLRGVLHPFKNAFPRFQSNVRKSIMLLLYCDTYLTLQFCRRCLFSYDFFLVQICLSCFSRLLVAGSNLQALRDRHSFLLVSKHNESLVHMLYIFIKSSCVMVFLGISCNKRYLKLIIKEFVHHVLGKQIL